MQVNDDMVAAAAESDAAFDGRTWLAMPKSERERYMERSRRSLTAALAEMWRPIAEAPKDGTDVWVMSRRWLMPCPAHFTSREYLAREYGDPEHMEEGWYPSHGFLFDLPEVTIEPTHFMPLPAPPRGK